MFNNVINKNAYIKNYYFVLLLVLNHFLEAIKESIIENLINVYP